MNITRHAPTLEEMTRRRALKMLAMGGFSLSFGAVGAGAATESAPDLGIPQLKTFLESLSRPDGGYAFPGQGRSHLTSSFAAVGCYHALGEQPPRPKQLASFIRENHPSRLKKLEQEHREFDYQQIQALVWLAQDVSEFKTKVETWTKPTVYLKQYEQQGIPILRHETATFLCRQLVGLPSSAISKAYVDYVLGRRRANGSFNNTEASDGADGHIVNTWFGLQALHMLGLEGENQARTAEWVRACQFPDGGFTWQPRPEFAGISDVVYTRAALRALELLQSRPDNHSACLGYLRSLLNADGGFAYKKGWQSNPLSTFYALEALSALQTSPVKFFAGVGRRSRPRTPTLRAIPGDLKVFSAQLEAHGQGSPSEAVDLADCLGLHLWGAKNAKEGWIRAAQEIADRRRVAVQFFAANEEYGTWIRFPGFGKYSHMSDIVASDTQATGESLAKVEGLTWQTFRKRRLSRLRDGNGRLIWQFGENEELVRLVLDDSVIRNGYSAISTFHFGNPDFTNSEPFLHAYRGQIPFVALQDAHGEEPWWFADMTTGFRTLFFAKEPSYSGFGEALDRGWIVAVRRDELSANETWIHAVSDECARYALDRDDQWRWWGDSPRQRPLVTATVLRPEGRFEAGCPEKGMNLRVRCAWSNTPQGRPKTPLAEMVSVTLDDKELLMEPARSTAANGALLDSYHLAPLGGVEAGEHEVVATVRRIADGAIVRRAIKVQL